MSIQLKRVYDHPDTEDGKRILVDRLWPRGLSKDEDDVARLLEFIGTQTVTFVYGSKETNMNNAFALKEYLESDA